MFEREIKFIYDFNINQVKRLGASFTFNSLSSTDLHPAIRNYVSAEVDYLIYEDRKKIIENSNFDYSGEEINKYFLLINNEIRKAKRLSSEYINQLILHATSFTANFLAQPKWALTKLVFAKEISLNTQEVKQILNYVYYYNHLKELLEKFFTKKRIITIDKPEFEILVDKIYNQLFSTYSEKIINNVLNIMADFFNVGSTYKTTVPLFALELFLKERKLEHYLDRLENALPVETKLSYSINELQNILFSPVPIKKGTYLERAIKQEEPVTLFSFEDKQEEIELKEVIIESKQQLTEQVAVDESNINIEKEVVENKTNEIKLEELPFETEDSVKNFDLTKVENVIEQKYLIDEEVLEEKLESAEQENPLDIVIKEPIVPFQETKSEQVEQPELSEQFDLISDKHKVATEITEEQFAKEEISETPIDDSIPISDILLEESEDQVTSLTEESELEIRSELIKKEEVTSISTEKELPTEKSEFVETLPLEENDGLKFTSKVEDFVIEEPNGKKNTTQKLIEKEIEELDLDLILSDEDFLILGEEKLKTNEKSIELEKEIESIEDLTVNKKYENEKIDFTEVKNDYTIENDFKLKSNEQESYTKEEILREIEEEEKELSLPESKVLNEIDEEIKILSDYSEPNQAEVNNESNLADIEEPPQTKPVDEIIETVEQDFAAEEKEKYVENPVTKENVKHQRDISDFFKGKDIDRIVTVVFAEDAEDFAQTFETLSECSNLNEAMMVLESLFKSNHVKPTSKEASTLKSIISEYFKQ